MRTQSLIISLLAVLVSPSLCLYFKVDYGSEKCFYETVPAMALISANYELINQEARDCSIVISGPDEKPVVTYKLRDGPDEGRVTHVATETANYNVCVQCNSHYWYISQECKISLSLEIADGSDDFGRSSQYDIDGQRTAKKEEIRELSAEIKRFSASVLSIQYPSIHSLLLSH
ncbi:GOLD domain [Babesia duncani]|uniref:GOLD domain n=1 Tax=Babesia duncani TaxID=323732 RepID=A0AAD9PNU9_9APIC|nr:GOLD domain [Babesia duncani]